MARNRGNQQEESTAQTENRRESGQQTAGAQTRDNQQTGMSRSNQQTGMSQANQQTGMSRRAGAGAPGGLFNNPFSLMRRFGEDMEQLFDEFGLGGLMPRGFDQIAAWTPQVEMLRRDGQLVIRADLPGVDKGNVEVELRDDAVVLRGERQEERQEEREGFYHTELSYGSFYREIPLPEGVDTSNATATFRDGVLEITMPASQGETRGRQLEIQDSQTGEQQRQQRQQAAGAGR